MRRREFIAIGGAAVYGAAARAQQPAMPVIGFVGGDRLIAVLLRAFRLGEATGFIEGQNWRSVSLGRRSKQIAGTDGGSCSSPSS
jgi:hypothetical protein